MSMFKLIPILIIMSLFTWVMVDIMDENEKYNNCDNLYDISDCSIYMCKYNYSISIPQKAELKEEFRYCNIEKLFASVLEGEQ